ncbi:Protein involved in microtubule-related processes [Komagataella phaffii CBS 7435]|uniref:Protein involved in microtubule-related processes n=1 Tax=Komagataella phaffii (strain ATCC 76273 / CBS 7435 / CECT 11047 / NRRL Y-11430 / Wegner 21-1) TaxID=981350 RepID=F2QNM7_KOMPC|nr:GQ67_02563T0 [Komagataella phaffii]AOA65710.1 GQ68_02685T0 [Komagataella phaffii GS115]CAH2446019.1 Protein involved in microtubule-related processes [Komagataella phaffii CBS 7435]CCA36460.1 Protein involved in microtubule-related processes [Komagataella phaffii CBS 7435]
MEWEVQRSKRGKAVKGAANRIRFQAAEKSVDDFLEILEKFRRQLVGFKDNIIVLDSAKKLRCVGLGSPTNSTAALYQLAFLLEIKDSLGIELISAFDPVFEPKDVDLFAKLSIEVEETYEFDKDETTPTIYYMPHLPVGILERTLETVKPRMLLTNDVTLYTLKMKNAEMKEKYPNITRLSNLVKDSSFVLPDDGFIIKKKKNGNFHPSLPSTDSSEPFDYSWYAEHLHFTRLLIGQDLSQEWGAAFSDLAIYKLT